MYYKLSQLVSTCQLRYKEKLIQGFLLSNFQICTLFWIESYTNPLTSRNSSNPSLFPVTLASSGITADERVIFQPKFLDLMLIFCKPQILNRD